MECQGVKAGFVKPFSQELIAEPDRTTALYRHISKLDTVEPIAYAKITQQLNDGETDELLEEAVSLQRQIAKSHDIVIVERLSPYCT